MGNKTITFDAGEAKDLKPYEYTYADISMVSESRLSSNFQTSPFSEEYRWRVAKKMDVDAVKGAVKNIFTWIPGERILIPDFGNTVRKYLYEGITDLNTDQIIAECQMLMTKWEPRAVIDKIFKKDSVEETENNQVSIFMIWHVVGLPNEKYQMELSI